MSEETNDTLRDDYDFSEGVREKYRHFIGQVRTLKVRHHDGSVTVETVAPATRVKPGCAQIFP